MADNQKYDSITTNGNEISTFSEFGNLYMQYMCLIMKRIRKKNYDAICM